MWDAIINFFADKNHSFRRKLTIGILVLIALIFIDGYLGFSTLYFEVRKSEALSHLSEIVKDSSLNKKMRIVAEQEFYKIANYTSWKEEIKLNSYIAVRALSHARIPGAFSTPALTSAPPYLGTILHILTSGWLILFIAYQVIFDRNSNFNRSQKSFGILIALVVTIANAVIFLFLPTPYYDLDTRLLCNIGYALLEFILLGIALMLFSTNFRKRVEKDKMSTHFPT